MQSTILEVMLRTKMIRVWLKMLMEVLDYFVISDQEICSRWREQTK